MNTHEPHVTGIIGPVEFFVAVLCRPPQQNEHTKGFRYYQFLQDCKIREANVRECARQIIAEARARKEGFEYAQAAE